MHVAEADGGFPAASLDNDGPFLIGRCRKQPWDTVQWMEEGMHAVQGSKKLLGSQAKIKRQPNDTG